ncbi:E3 ubiquitin protein ligase DRIP1 isoform X2 [Eutrema salsugineum]|uniref:E3 ubiquitin protein ligase DRIP1 isoform X2 n=1 Tax=Eutrema salsugineum TaxID=72664 RepID=UPI000CED13F4|nr:E3 ubiquitin protein ligase DRIP1 isoform X2 [Eutrema salsugineum]
MVSQVKRETMKACLSCPLCDHILRDATTISECLHTFCRKCIYEKITEDEIESCPVCNIDLGSTPLEKLRPDHNLQDLRAKIFPLKRRKVKAPEIVSLPARRKERSMSSLVVSTPSVSAQTGRRTKAATRKELRDSGSLAERTVKKEESFGDDLLENTSSPDKFTQNKKESYAESFSNKEKKDGDEPWDSKMDWKPLNFLVDVANRTKPLKSSASQGQGSKSEHAKASHKQFQGRKTKFKDQKSRCEREDETTNHSDPTTSETATPKRMRRTERKRSATNFGDTRNSPQQDESSAKRERRYGPVWFSLVASSDQEVCLPQIPANFLRIRDGNIPVSFIQKYLMRKLDLESESEIEIRCMGEAVMPTLELQKVVDLWLQRSSNRQRFAASIGSSAKDYMMVLVYARKLPECNK